MVSSNHWCLIAHDGPVQIVLILGACRVCNLILVAI